MRAITSITTAAVATALLLAGCSSVPDEGDRVACETVIDAENAVNHAMHEVLDGDGDRDLFINLMRGMPDRIAEAQVVAESPELRIALDRLHRLSDYDAREDEEIGRAYFLMLYDVERVCQDAGAEVELDG